MTTINTVSELLKASNVTNLAPKNFSKIFRYIGENQAAVSEGVIAELASVMKGSTEATTLAYKAIQSLVEDANERASQSSLKNMGNVINVLHENGVSDKRIDELLPRLLQHKHEMEKIKVKGDYDLGKIGLIVSGVLAAIFLSKKMDGDNIKTSNATKPRKFWES